MKSKLSFEKREGYLYAKITGAYNETAFMSYAEKIYEACKREKTYKVLLDGLVVRGTDVPTTDRFFIGERYAEVLGSKIKLAVLWREKHIDHFYETVVRNRGGFVFVSGDLESALEWLLDDSEA